MLGEKFELIFDRVHFEKGDILKYEEGREMEAIGTPKLHYCKWYWRVLNFLTFKKFFNAKYSHTVRLI